MSAPRIRLLLADDHTLVRQGLRALLERESDLEVVGEAADGRDAVRKAATLRPDVVIMDVCMPRLNGIEATVRIVAAAPQTRVVALSMQGGEDYIYPLLEAGAKGFVLKESPVADLVAAIRAVQSGGTYLHPHISGTVVDGFLGRPGKRGRGAPRPDNLTTREREVLQLIAEGHTNRQIASELSLSVKTVEAHRASLMTKLKVHNTAGLTRCAISRGLTGSD